MWLWWCCLLPSLGKHVLEFVVSPLFPLEILGLAPVGVPHFGLQNCGLVFLGEPIALGTMPALAYVAAPHC